MNQEKEEIKLDLLPFIARAIAEKPTARQQLDAIYADSRIIIEKAPAKTVQVYNRYYRESDVKEKDELEEKLADVNQLLAKLLASRQQENESEPDLDPVAIEQVARLKIIIIGGRTDWQQPLREK